MYNKMKLLTSCLVLLALLVGLAGCATPATTLKAHDALSAGEGALLLVSHCAYKDGVKFEILRLSGSGPSKTQTHTFNQGTEFAVFKFPPGRYILKRLIIGSLNLTIPGHGKSFEIVPDRVSYLGDVFLKELAADSVDMKWINRQKQADELLQSNYAGLANSLPLAKIEFRN